MESKSKIIVYRMALIMGIFLPLAETVRRFHQLADITQFFHWFDDYMLGGVLIWSALYLKREKPNAFLYMIAAFGIGTGALFLSFLGQVDYIISGETDPGGVFSVWFVLIAKAIILGYMIFGMTKSIEESN
ncbi:MAG: hypothetical protein ABJB16_12285 [Saprospiraceae bacterium]